MRKKMCFQVASTCGLFGVYYWQCTIVLDMQLSQGRVTNELSDDLKACTLETTGTGISLKASQRDLILKTNQFHRMPERLVTRVLSRYAT